MHPLIKAGITPLMTLEDFRRHLMDLEPGLRRGNQSQYRSSSTLNNANISTGRFNTTQNTTTNSTSGLPRAYNSNQTTSIPRTPCVCGGYHWRRDCPNKAPQSNPLQTPLRPTISTPPPPTPNPNSNRFPPRQTFPNSIPNNNGNKWQPRNNSRPTTNTSTPVEVLPPHPHQG
ncbi:hypothetical protein M231_06178 [Tremella mesenterica]|uniref:CCHC-type domain-containing protein n=2 Tax=Tremella mesenterica TaxID=5217 RepID=A0A4Q1BCK1_TREME|nr:hypothetical protein M231_06178 [Tremella mesenterica]